MVTTRNLSDVIQLGTVLSHNYSGSPPEATLVTCRWTKNYSFAVCVACGGGGRRRFCFAVTRHNFRGRRPRFRGMTSKHGSTQLLLLQFLLNANLDLPRIHIPSDGRSRSAPRSTKIPVLPTLPPPPPPAHVNLEVKTHAPK